jgi:hypothetical protein
VIPRAQQAHRARAQTLPLGAAARGDPFEREVPRRAARARHDQLKIICTNSEQEEAEEELESRLQRRALDIGFNINYLLDVLQNMAMDSVAARIRRRQLERARHLAGTRRLQVRRDADAHLTPTPYRAYAVAPTANPAPEAPAQPQISHDDSQQAEAPPER